MAKLRNRVGALIAKAFPALTRPVHSSLWGWVRESFAGAWQQGVTVDPLGSITSFGAVYACITRIASDIAKLEPKLLQLDAEQGIWALASSLSPFWQVLRKPNPYQNRIQFFTSWIVSKLMYGNAYALKVRDGRGVVVALFILDPRRVTPMVAPNGDVFYSLGGDDLSRIPAGQVVPAAEMIHDRAATLWHPLVGVSPLYGCGLSATQGLRIQSNSAKFFENMSRPSGMLTSDGTISDETAARLKREWEQNYSGQNIGRLAVGGDGLKYLPMTIPAETAQLIQQLGWTVEDVARCFRVPLYKINAGPMPTAGNVEALELQYYSGCLQELIESIEINLTEGLKPGADMAVEFDLEGLLRMDAGAKMDMLTKGVGGAILKPDEARARMNLPRVAGGNAVYLQQQNFSLEALARRDAREDPFAKDGGAKPPAPTPAPAPEPPATNPADAAKHIAEAASAAGAAAEASARAVMLELVERMQRPDPRLEQAEASAAAARQVADAATAQLDALLARIEGMEQAQRAAAAAADHNALTGEDAEAIEKGLTAESIDV